MKRIVLTLMAVVAALTASAQSDYIVQTGKIIGPDGSMRFVEPKSTIAVEITVEKHEVLVGPYARYAQKYLGKRATLSEYASIELLDGKLALGVADRVAPKVEQEPYTTPLPSNRVSATVQNFFYNSRLLKIFLSRI